jgi:hypothetical protein
LTFTIENNGWRALRSYKNGLVYGGASWNAGYPQADDTVNYIPDTAWIIGDPWVTSP